MAQSIDLKTLSAFAWVAKSVEQENAHKADASGVALARIGAVAALYLEAGIDPFVKEGTRQAKTILDALKSAGLSGPSAENVAKDARAVMRAQRDKYTDAFALLADADPGDTEAFVELFVSLAHAGDMKSARAVRKVVRPSIASKVSPAQRAAESIAKVDADDMGEIFAALAKVKTDDKERKPLAEFVDAFAQYVAQIEEAEAIRKAS